MTLTPAPLDLDLGHHLDALRKRARREGQVPVFPCLSVNRQLPGKAMPGCEGQRGQVGRQRNVQGSTRPNPWWSTHLELAGDLERCRPGATAGGS